MFLKNRVMILAILLLLPTSDVFAETQLAAKKGRQRMEDRMPAELLAPLVADSVPVDLQNPYTVNRVTDGAQVDYHPEFSPDGKHIVFISRRDITAEEKAGEFWHSTPFYLNLSIMDSDGSNRRALTTGETQDFAPRFSPDGEKVIFVSNRDSVRWDIWSVNVDGSGLERVTDNIVEREHYPGLTPDGKELVFVIYKRAHGSIWLADMEGTNLRRVTSGGFGDDFPVISPDGEKIVFKSTRQGNGDIWSIDRTGKNYKRLTYEEYPEFDPAWSPDGKKISYVTNKGGVFDVWIMDKDGSNKKKLTKYLSRGAWGSKFDYNDLIDIGYYHVSWHPEGTSMVLTTWDPGEKNRTYISILDFKKDISDTVDGMPVDAEPIKEYTLIAEKELTKGKWNDFAPCFSPDGNSVIYASNRDGNWDIWSVRVENEELTQLTKEGGDELAPVFSPDGTKIAYLKPNVENSKYNSKNPTYNIWIMGSQGTGAKQVTADIPAISFPAWSSDGQEIAFVSRATQGAEIWRYDVKTNVSKKIVSVGDSVESDSLLASFIGDVESNLTASEIRKLKKLFPSAKDGMGGLTPFTQGETKNITYPLPEFLYRIDYDGGGEKLTFESNRAGNIDIWTMKRDGSEMTRVTKGDGLHLNPVFSPDGKKIAYARQKFNTSSFNEKNYNIWIADAESGEEMMINGEEQTDWNPTWSPDGKRIAYVTNRSGEFEHFSIWMLYLK